jgi:hypothetical protein
MAREDREMEPDDPRYIPEDLVLKLKDERTALNPDQTDEQQSRNIFLEHAPAAAATIAHIALHDPSSRMRFDASKYITERVLGRAGDDGGGSDPLEGFLEKLSKAAEEHANSGSKES